MGSLRRLIKLANPWLDSLMKKEKGNKQNQGWKRQNYYRHHRNTKDHKRILWEST